MSTLSSLAKGNLKNNKSKSILIAFTIMLTTILLTSVGLTCLNWVKANKEITIERVGSYHSTYKNITIKELDIIKNNIDIEKFGVLRTVGVAEENENTLSIIYTDEDSAEMGNIKFLDGKMPIKENEIAVQDGFLKAIGIENDEEVYSLAVVNNIFGGSISSRLFQKIREEKGLVYSIYSAQSLYRKSGELGIFASMSIENLSEVLEIVKEEIKVIKENYLTEKEISESKEQLKGSYLLGLESTSSRMMSIGKSMLLLNKVKTTDEILECINNVNIDSVNKVIDKVFDLNNLGVCIVGRDVENIKL